MKVCLKCSLEKNFSDFYKRKSSPDGHHNTCKKCKCEAAKNLRDTDIVKSRELDREKYQKNSDKRKAASSVHYHKTKETKKAQKSEYHKRYNLLNKVEKSKLSKIYYLNNRDKWRAKVARRKAQKLNATPSWADIDSIGILYAKARRLDVWLNQSHHVDHIVPLQSDVVCGLHNEFNLRITTQAENLSKGNRFWPDMWN